MQKYLHVAVGGILAGMLIGIGATVYLSVLSTSKIVASLLFGFGLFAIIQLDLYLFTGKIGFVLQNKPTYLVELLVGIVTNFLGIVVFCLLVKMTRIGDGLALQATELVNAKQNDYFYSILLLSFACGIMVYLAVKGHKVATYGLAKAVLCFGAVSIFILCGFEHCIANAAYYIYAGVANWKAVGYFMLMILGNSLGAITMDSLLRLLVRFKNTPTSSDSQTDATDN